MSLDEQIRAQMAAWGKKGGKKKGETKRRGDAEYYRAIARKAHASRYGKKDGTTPTETRR